MNRLLLIAALLSSSTARAEPAGEVNVLWPFIGISELKVVTPVVAESSSTRGELVLGTYLDYAQIVRPNAGKAFIIAAIVGYRQFLGHGIHIELAPIIGVRHEKDHPSDGMTLDDGYVRAFVGVGYQYDVSPQFYVNARARLGILVYRSSHWDEEKKLAPGADVNVGVRF